MRDANRAFEGLAAPRAWTRGPICNLAGSAALLVALASCTSGDDVGRAESAAIAVPGPWIIPDDVRAAGDTQFVEYTGAGPWQGESGCGGGLLEGTGVLREYLYEHFPQAWEIGGYSCRPIVGAPNSMSVHATGRAMDIMIYPVGYPDGSEADNEMGDPIAHWLIVNAERIGIQMIIWDRWLWQADDPPGEKDRPYSGEHPHNDHLHVELSVEAAALGTPFFQEPQGPPVLPSCGQVPAEGGVIDDLDRCADFFGPPEFWRSVDGAGEGGHLLWTNVFQSAEPSNWAKWSLDMAEAGRYRIEFHAVPEYSVATQVRYEVRHGETTEEIWVDPSGASGWVSLGEFDLAAGGYQYVAMFDDVPDPVADEQHVAFDALRVTPCDGDECGSAGGDGGDDGAGDGPSDDGGGGDGGSGGGDGGGGDDGVQPGGEEPELAGGGCAAGGGDSTAIWLAFALVALLTRAAGRRR